MSNNNIKIGMSKKEFCIQVSSFRFSQDPCSQPLLSSINKVPGAYYPETKMEIMHDSKKEYFFVFKNVNIPYDYKNFKYGDGVLDKIFRSFDEAKDYSSGKKFSINKDKIEKAKEYCRNLGLEPKTEKFAECTLKRISN
tara:strand:- start:180 stop:596 length:417 start_codon:yes stop_codon:yes gene_type:complete